MYRTGIGFDVHAFEDGRELYLGGILIEYEKGLKGHSDADVLLHAVIDALLGASAIGDIGELFPDNDPAYKNIRSTILLRKAMERIREKKYVVENIDCVVVCEKPKILPYREEIRAYLAWELGISIDQVMVKGKTSEKLGFTGRGEGIAAQAAALLRKEE